MDSDRELAVVIARSFNEGSDARLAGKRLESCPYESGKERCYWLLGWRDVHGAWGLWVEGRWRFLPLMRFMG